MERNWPAARVSVPGTAVGSCFKALFRRLPGRSLGSDVTMIGVLSVGFDRRITGKKGKKLNSL